MKVESYYRSRINTKKLNCHAFKKGKEAKSSIYVEYPA